MFGTSSVEIAQAFGTGIGTMFLHMSILFVFMVILAIMSLPIILANTGGVRKSNRRTLNPSPILSTTLGNSEVVAAMLEKSGELDRSWKRAHFFA